MRARSRRWSGWCGRMSPSSPLWRRAISDISLRSKKLPMPRRKSFCGVEAGGHAVLNRDNPFFDRLAAAARRAGHSATSSASAAHEKADVRLGAGGAACRLLSCVTADVLGEKRDLQAWRAGRAYGAQQPCGARRSQAGGRRSGPRGAGAGGCAKPAKGRGVHHQLRHRIRRTAADR